jgi:hypothetical protein
MSVSTTAIASVAERSVDSLEGRRGRPARL